MLLEALDMLRETAYAEDPYKLVLLDHMMAEMDGEQTARQIKADPLIKNTILVMLTSCGNRGDVKRLAEVG